MKTSSLVLLAAALAVALPMEPRTVAIEAKRSMAVMSFCRGQTVC